VGRRHVSRRYVSRPDVSRVETPDMSRHPIPTPDQKLAKTKVTPDQKAAAVKPNLSAAALNENLTALTATLTDSSLRHPRGPKVTLRKRRSEARISRKERELMSRESGKLSSKTQRWGISRVSRGGALPYLSVLCFVHVSESVERRGDCDRIRRRDLPPQ
jgi:hypothetical protein